MRHGHPHGGVHLHRGHAAREVDEVQPRRDDQGHQPGHHDGPVAAQRGFERGQDFSANFWNVWHPAGTWPRLTAKVHVTSLT